MSGERTGNDFRIEKICCRRGLPETHRASAARLYDEAFGKKLSAAVRSSEKRYALLRDCLDPQYAIVAMEGDRLMGIAGFHTESGSFTGGVSSGYLFSMLGFLRGARAALLLALYDRKPEQGELLMDGIAVDRECRGKGIGGLLLDALEAFAREEGFDRLRLDVIDSNPGARALYERVGFRALGTARFPYLRWLLGFGGSTTMVKEIRNVAAVACSFYGHLY